MLRGRLRDSTGEAEGLVNIPVDATFERVEPTSTERLAGYARIALLVLIVCAAGTLLVLFFTTDSVKTAVLTGLEWLADSYDEQPVLSTILCGLLYAVSLLFFLPGTPFNLAAGFLYGIWIGTAVAMGGAFFGSMIAFFSGRYVFRVWITDMVHVRYPKFKAVDLAVRKKGLLIVFLTRLSPVFPFPLLNYAFGVTQISVLHYSLGTVVGLLPFTLAYTYLGTLMRSLTDMWADPKGDDGDTTTILYLIIGAIFTVLTVVVISIVTKRAIDRATKEFGPPVETVEVITDTIASDRMRCSNEKTVLRKSFEV